jgi:hypothetical protein
MERLLREVRDDPSRVPYRRQCLGSRVRSDADPQSILHLAEQKWSSVLIADALEARPGYEGLHQLIEYAATRLRDESLEDPTWAALDCVVDPSDATRWLAENRPEIAAKL